MSKGLLVSRAYYKKVAFILSFKAPEILFFNFGITKQFGKKNKKTSDYVAYKC